MHRRRRLTLARLQPSTRASPGSGSRFSCLADEAVSDDGGGSSVAEDVAWQGLDDDPLVPPMELKPEMSQEEIMAEFWGKIGYPTPESRPWEQTAPSSASPEVRAVLLSCRSDEMARSSSPVRGMAGGLEHRAASSSPVGLRLARPPRMGAW
jgi:hypothetical protein